MRNYLYALLFFSLKNSLYKEEKTLVRNKEKGFPNQDDQKLEGMPRAQAKYASLRADGTINTHPQERMHASNKRGNQ